MDRTKARKIAGWILSGLLGLMFIATAVMKLTASKEALKPMEGMGFGGRAVLLGVGELVSALLFLAPKTHPLGVLLLSGYMGGAIATHMQHSQSFVAQSVILALIWVAGFLRRPALLLDPPAAKAADLARLS